MRRFTFWLFNLDVDLQNSTSVVAGLLWSRNFLTTPFSTSFHLARKRIFQEALRALFVSGTAVSGKDFAITMSNLVPEPHQGLSFNLILQMVAALSPWRLSSTGQKFSHKEKFSLCSTLSNLGNSIPLSNLGGGGGANPPENNNCRFLNWISIKFYMVVVPHKTNLNISIFETIRCNITSQWCYKNLSYYARIPTTKMQDQLYHVFLVDFLFITVSPTLSLNLSAI